LFSNSIDDTERLLMLCCTVQDVMKRVVSSVTNIDNFSKTNLLLRQKMRLHLTILCYYCTFK